MKLSQYYLVIAIVFVTVVLLSIVWEFWLEGLIGTSLIHTHEAESITERWEYVYSIAIFVAISLIIPLFYGRKLIAHQQALHVKISRIAAEYSLTGLFNRRKINELIQHEIERSERYKKGFSVIIMDIDYFKRVNDRHGHLAGDELLKMFAHILLDTIRHTDEVGRWGGEEFVVLCPETNMDGALLLANKIRQKIDSSVFNDYGKQTASFGIACYKNDDTIDSIISHADQALYMAKNSGRNRVEAHN
jgi:polar amino acid transport system substrate-binding protein